MEIRQKRIKRDVIIPAGSDGAISIQQYRNHATRCHRTYIRPATVAIGNISPSDGGAIATQGNHVIIATCDLLDIGGRCRDSRKPVVGVIITMVMHRTIRTQQKEKIAAGTHGFGAPRIRGAIDEVIKEIAGKCAVGQQIRTKIAPTCNRLDITPAGGNRRRPTTQGGRLDGASTRESQYRVAVATQLLDIAPRRECRHLR